MAYIPKYRDLMDLVRVRSLSVEPEVIQITDEPESETAPFDNHIVRPVSIITKKNRTLYKIAKDTTVRNFEEGDIALGDVYFAEVAYSPGDYITKRVVMFYDRDGDVSITSGIRVKTLGSDFYEGAGDESLEDITYIVLMEKICNTIEIGKPIPKDNAAVKKIHEENTIRIIIE